MSARAQPAPERAELPRWLWLWLPLFALIAIGGLRLWDGLFYWRCMEGEGGVIENATALALLPGVLAGFGLWRRRAVLPRRWLAVWFAGLALGCLYFAGEEISWGQHWFGWATPAPVAARNDQEETNLHNMSSWLDQKPRGALRLWALIGGVAAPLALRGRRFDPHRDWRAWLWPPLICLPAAALALLVHLPEDLSPLGVPRPPPFDIRVAEVQELYLALFLSLSLLAAWRRAHWRVEG